MVFYFYNYIHFQYTDNTFCWDKWQDGFHIFQPNYFLEIFVCKGLKNNVLYKERFSVSWTTCVGKHGLQFAVDWKYKYLPN